MNSISGNGVADASAPLRNLARWTLSDDPAWADPLIARQARLLILDSLACAVDAIGVRTPVHVAAMLEEMGGKPQCSLIGQAEKSSILAAVLMNGALVRSLDYNDVQFFMKEGKLSVAGHCSDNIPVALAAAERFGSTGDEIIRALAMGYELFKRLRNLMPFTSAWDGTSVSGLVSAAIYGKLAGLDPERQSHALALGAIRCATPSVVRWGKLSGAKNLANSLIAQSGVQGAMLAERGVTGPLEVLDHRGGLHQVFDPALDLSTLWAPPADPAYIMTSNIKPYACIGTAQCTIKAALEIHEVVRDRLDRAERIEIIMADLPMIRKQQGEIERRYPKTREAADHSFTFLPAVAMAEGAMTDEQFRDRRWEHPDMTRLIEATELMVDPDLAARAPGSMPSRIRVVFDDGSEVVQECLYHPGHSFPDRGLDEDAVLSKFHAITDARMGAENATALAGDVLALGQGGIGPVMDRLRVIGPAT
ncbi:hypothetical protein HKCCE2091_02240 [Rhodobacterales bacterium HKCCE2091]|nr:hypothetical protein [Rhodobacterales bacterium HKCCE2091]